MIGLAGFPPRGATATGKRARQRSITGLQRSPSVTLNSRNGGWIRRGTRRHWRDDVSARQDGAMFRTAVLRFAMLFLSSILLRAKRAAGPSGRLAHVSFEANKVNPGL